MLIYAGKPIVDVDYNNGGNDKTLGDYGIVNSSTVNLGLRLRGGLLELKIKFEVVEGGSLLAEETKINISTISTISDLKKLVSLQPKC